jgi:hypothetical protein
MDADRDSDPDAYNIGTGVEDDAGSRPAFGGIIVGDDIACVLHLTLFPAVKQ